MRARQNDRGVTLVETMFAILIAFIAMAAVGPLLFSALVANKNQGTEATRMTTLAQEKMNELLRLSYYANPSGAPCSPYTAVGSACVDTTTNTTLITDSGWAVGLTDGGGTKYLTSCPSGAPDQGYVDFLDNTGVSSSGGCASIITSPFGYERRWQISTVSTGLKQITVVVYDLKAVSTNRVAQPPYVTLTTLKSQ